MTTTNSAPLNPIEASWLPRLRACAPDLDCAGCAKPGKCCDFQPFVPNFLLGAALAEGVSLPDRPGEHHWQPLGLVPGKSFRARHALAPTNPLRGPLLCQFFDKGTGKCGIWSFRPGECATHFCEGSGRSNRALARLSFKAESTVAQMALRQLGFGASAIHRQVDILNLESEPEAVSFADLKVLYMDSWAWASHLTRNEVLSFL